MEEKIQKKVKHFLDVTQCLVFLTAALVFTPAASFWFSKTLINRSSVEAIRGERKAKGVNQA